MYLFIHGVNILFVRADEIIVGAPTYGEVGDVNIGQIHIYITSSDVNISVSSS